jgi:pimeloyl-ACP methyl ester carboxylesterase
MLVDLVRTTAPDGLRLDGALLEPTTGARSRVGAGTAVLCLHGVGSAFYGSNLFEAISPALTQRGFAVLWANTRGHDGLVTTIATGKRRHFGAAAEIVDECRLDVAAWRSFLQDRGYDRLALLGHSLGAVKALYAVVQGTVAKGEPAEFIVAASPPSLSYRRLLAGKDGAAFRRWIDEAKRLIDAGAGDRLFEPNVPFPLVISARTYWDKYGAEERYDFLQFLGQVDRPTLFTYGELELRGEGTPFTGLPERIREIAGERSPIATRIVPGADHAYRGVADAWSAVVADWIDARS